MIYNLKMNYNIGEYKLDTDKTLLNIFCNEIYNISNNEAKDYKKTNNPSNVTQYINVLNSPDISSLRLWEQTDIFNPLLNTILSYGKHYFNNNELNISSAWSVVYKTNNYSTIHNHEGNNTGSFVYYLTTSKNSPIFFNDSNFYIDCEEDTLLLFPSFVNHSVPPHKGKEDRLVIAGNFL